MLIGVGIMLLAQIAGLRIDWRAYLAMAVWLAANYVMAPWAVRPADFSQRRRRYAVTIVVDVLVLSVLYLSLDAVQWLGIGLFVNSALVASATLPRRWVYGITALIVAVYGTLAWFAVSGVLAMPSPFGLAPVRGNTGFLVGQILSSATVLLLMVTLQEHLVRTIRDAEQRFLALVQAVPDMVMTFDSRGNFVYVNPATLEQSGYNRDELTRIPDARFFPQEELPKVQDALERTIAGETTSLELRYLRKSGESRWIQAKAVPFGLHGESEALLVIARDVTDARKRTDEVYANEARIRAIVDSLNVGFATLDTEGRVTSIFGAFAEGVQMAGASLSGVTVRELRVGGEPLPAALLAQIEGSVELALRGESINTHWRNVPTSSQPVRHLRAHLAPLRDAQREIVGVAAVWSDETADVMAEQERDVLRSRLAHAAYFSSPASRAADSIPL